MLSASSRKGALCGKRNNGKKGDYLKILPTPLKNYLFTFPILSCKMVNVNKQKDKAKDTGKDIAMCAEMINNYKNTNNWQNFTVDSDILFK